MTRAELSAYTPASASSDRLALLVALLIFAALSLAASVTSDGFLEADGCTHYLYARFALTEPHYLVNVWGRPLCTAVYAVPAYLGNRFGVRTASLVIALGCALIARSIARALGDRRPTLAAIFTLAQPLFFLHSFSELTELPFALLLAAAFLAYIRRWFFLMAILIGLSPLGRPEGFGFLILGAVALLAHRQFAWLILLPVPLLLWDYAGWTLYGHPHYPGLAERLPDALRWLMWLPNNWPYADKSLYKPGSLFHFIMLLPTVISPVIFPALWIGVWRTFSSPSPGTPGEGRGEGDLELLEVPAIPNHPHPNPLPEYRERGPDYHLVICRWLTALIPLLILIVHSLLYYLGRMASSGELRYMLVVSPFWGILAARGWMWIFESRKWRFPLRWAALAAMVPLLANAAYPVVPLIYVADWQQARELAHWLDSTPRQKEYPHILTAHPGIYYFLNVSITDHTRALEWKKTTIDDAPNGTLLIWDSVYGVYNADTARSVPAEEILKAGWIEIPAPLADTATLPYGGTWRVFLSPRTISGAASK